MSELLPPAEMRVSDADRALVETRLRRAVAAGQLELHEFDQRARLAWAARTRGELDGPRRTPGASRRHGAGPVALRHRRRDRDGGADLIVRARGRRRHLGGGPPGHRRPAEPVAEVAAALGCDPGDPVRAGRRPPPLNTHRHPGPAPRRRPGTPVDCGTGMDQLPRTGLPDVVRGQ